MKLPPGIPQLPARHRFRVVDVAQSARIGDGLRGLARETKARLDTDHQDQTGLLGSLGHGGSVDEGGGHGLLDQDVLARVERIHGGGGVRLVPRTDTDGLDLIHLEDVVIVHEDLRDTILLGRAGRFLLDDVADRDDLDLVRLGQRAHVRLRNATSSDQC